MKKIICIDIDNVICKTVGRNYVNAKPNKKVLQKINEMYKDGYIIKFFTARYMGRNNDKAIKAKKQGWQMTANQLKKWKVNYHKLIFGKPSFDLIIDDKALFFRKDWYKNINKILKKI